MSSVIYKLIGRGHRLTTEKLYEIAKAGGWVLYRADSDNAISRAYQKHLIADTYTGDVHFYKSGADNWSTFEFFDGSSPTAVLEQMLEFGFGGCWQAVYTPMTTICQDFRPGIRV